MLFGFIDEATRDKLRRRGESPEEAQAIEKARRTQALNAQAVRARGDDRERNAFIEACVPMLRRCLYHIEGRPIGESDDEWSVALLAFNEAVDSYNPERGAFSGHMYQVAKRRLVDHHRRTARHRREVDVSPHAFTDDAREQAPVAQAIQLTAQPMAEQRALQEELRAATGRLKPYGIAFMDLTTCSPQTKKTRKACAVAVACILERPPLLEAVRRKRTLPLKRIQEETGLPQKVLERHRKYILAVAILMQGDYPFLQEYFHLVKEEMRT